MSVVPFPWHSSLRDSTYQCLSNGVEIPPHYVGVAIGAEILELRLMDDDGGAVGSFVSVDHERFFDAVEPIAE